MQRQLWHLVNNTKHHLVRVPGRLPVPEAWNQCSGSYGIYALQACEIRKGHAHGGAVPPAQAQKTADKVTELPLLIVNCTPPYAAQ